MNQGGKDLLVVAAWFPVEVFEGKTILSHHANVAEDVLYDVWRDIDENDVISIPATIQIDLAGKSEFEVSRLDLLASEPGTFLPDDAVTVKDGKLLLGPIELTPMPTIWVITLDDSSRWGV